jgi:hypothetical protein
METVIHAVTNAVTVFPDRARLTCSGSVSLEAGLHQIVIADLPLTLLPDSVRASGKGTARARLLGVSTHLEHYRETPAAAVRELEEQLQAAHDASAELAARQRRWERSSQPRVPRRAERDLRARAGAAQPAAGGAGAIFDFLRERLARLQAEILARHA